MPPKQINVSWNAHGSIRVTGPSAVKDEQGVYVLKLQPPEQAPSAPPAKCCSHCGAVQK